MVDNGELGNRKRVLSRMKLLDKPPIDLALVDRIISHLPGIIFHVAVVLYN